MLIVNVGAFHYVCGTGVVGKKKAIDKKSCY